jgi:hypothetical protein
MSIQKWEYSAVLRTRGRGPTALGGKPTNWSFELSQWLKDSGENGWELVTVVPISDWAGEVDAGWTSSQLWVFKRPID